MSGPIERMVTEARAERVARKLFPAEYHNGEDCRAEIGREGLPCRICAARADAWKLKLSEVRAAIIDAFS